METPKSYCQVVASLPEGDLHRMYHDTAYGFPIEDDNELFGRLVLEINQAGLSWSTILRKQEAFRKAYDQFDIATVAAYGQEDQQRLLADAGIIRNRLKVAAAIANARTLLAIQQSHGSFRQWLDMHHPRSLQDWVKLFKTHFRFTGGEIVNEFLMSTGYLPGAHQEGCPIYQQVLESGAAWTRNAH
jgi:DNA-3-methyladenine glycosylase I